MHQRLHVVYTDNPSLELLGPVLDQIQLPERDAKIALKPNLVVAKPSESGATTDPRLVETVIQYLQNKGYTNISIMEGSWVGDSTKRAFKVCGYEEISRKYKVPLIDLKQDARVSVEVEGTTLEVCASLWQADYLINMPVLKAHCQTKVTCALKNLKGCIPDSEKRRFHSMGLHRPIALLNKVLKSNLVIVDGIIGDLTFEEGGTPVYMGRVIIGEDPVAIDAYAAELLGYHPHDIHHLQIAEELGVGTADSARLEIVEHNQAEKSRVEELTAQRVVDRYAGYIDEREACSACFGSLIHALYRYEERHGRLPRNLQIAIGQGFKESSPSIHPGNRQVYSGVAMLSRMPPAAARILQRLEELA